MHDNETKDLGLELHTGLGIRKPENKFQKLRKKDITIAAI
jgi:hypothetical protein